jgi:hypothetical protein
MNRDTGPPKTGAVVGVNAVAVEKVAFLEKLSKFGDRKCPGDPRESFIGHPDAILFSRLSREGVFQQPRLISTVSQMTAGLLAEDSVHHNTAIMVGPRTRNPQ